MNPLSEVDRRMHVQIAQTLKTAEAAWNEVVNGDLEAGADLYEKAAETLRSIKKIKVVSIRGPKGRG